MSESPKASRRCDLELRILDYWKENQIYQKHKKKSEKEEHVNETLKHNTRTNKDKKKNTKQAYT